MNFSQFLSTLVDLVWGLPLVILLMGGGIALTIRSKLLPIKYFFTAWRLILGKIPEDEDAKGQLSHFAALCNALSSTIGMGNIAGVAVAIYQGGPGTIFWMWVSAIVGMCSKFFECSLAVMYRGEDYRGEVQGGPMYVIEKAMPKVFKPLAYIFAICALVGTLSMFQTNQLAVFLNTQYAVPNLATGIACGIFVLFVLFGGVVRVASVTTKIVPLMCLLYVIAGLIIIFMNFSAVPDVFALIFKEAFTGRAAVGAVSGLAVREVMKLGIKRAVFSNEAGVGSAPLAHGNAKTNDPIKEGLVAMVGPFLDTIIVCTITALVILLSVDLAQTSELSGIELTTLAFKNNFSDIGVHLLGLAIFLFSFSTMIGMANYGVKCWNYIFKGKSIFKEITYIILCSLTMVYAATSSPGDIINILDIGFGMMAFPAMFSTLYLSGKVLAQMKKSKILKS